MLFSIIEIINCVVVLKIAGMVIENAVVWVESGGIWVKVGVDGRGGWLEFRGMVRLRSLRLVVW